MPAEDRRFSSPQSVMRVIQVLETLAASPKSLGLADLSRELGTPKSSLAALLRGLSEADVVVGVDGSYRLGAGAFGLGSALVEARRRVQSSDIVREGMRRLADQSGETVLFAVRDHAGTSLTYVDVIESRNAVRFAVSAGDRRPLYCTAAGRMLLATVPEDEVQRYLARLRPEKMTGGTEKGKKRLAEVIASARKLGFSQTVDQAADGVAGTAASVREAGDRVAGVLVLAAPTSRAQGRGEELADMVVLEAARISRGLGFRAMEA